MDVFAIRKKIITAYSEYAQSFIQIQDDRIRNHVEEQMSEGAFWPDPLIQLNPRFESGGTVRQAIDDGYLHPMCDSIFLQDKDQGGRTLRFHRHQRRAIEVAQGGHNYVLTTGTGSGKSLAYIAPIVDHVLRRGSGQGIQAIVVYPMNALVNSQEEELGKFLKEGSAKGEQPVTFERYTGQVPDEERERIINDPPDILLTNYVMLELIMTRPVERRLIERARGLRFVVLDELHTYRGRQGADVALLMRRVRERLEVAGQTIQFVGTSATMASGGSFEKQRQQVAQVSSDVFGAPILPEHVIGETLQRATPGDLDSEALSAAVAAGDTLTVPVDYEAFIAHPLSIWIENTFGLRAVDARLQRQTPRSIESAAEALSELTAVDAATCEAIIQKWLLAGYEFDDPTTALKPFAFRLHQFISPGDTAYATLETEAERHITLSGQRYFGADRKLLFPLSFCRECGQEYYTVSRVEGEDGEEGYVPRDFRERYREYYSTQHLRKMAASFVGTRHSDLFEALRLVMRLLGGEDKQADGSALGIAPLGSFLFSDRAAADIIDCKISNRQLLSAVRSLSLIDDREARAWRNVDYKNLGPEELGSVYESLLELHPHINVDARGFALETAGGNERKTSGSYYTPSSLIKVLLDSALDPVLDEAAKQGEEAILNLKICDPASGSGHFLIAAANRMAKRLASLRTGEEEPALPALQAAKRDIIGRCIYGVDINPMAAELCKVSLWLEALDPGKPLTFLDHHIQVGNSLLGATPKLMAEGIPNDAFKPIEGDDKKTASALRKQNRGELKQREAGVKQLGLEQAPAADYGYLSDSMNLLASAPDNSLADVRDKEEFYAALAQDEEYIKARLLADAWCSAFVWEKRHPPRSPQSIGGMDLPLTDLLYRRLEAEPHSPQFDGLRQKVAALTDRYGFFHWHVAFPDVFQAPENLDEAENEAAGWNGGFDVVLGNPPWEQIQLDDREFFAVSAPDIANARNMAARKRMIKDLADQDPFLYRSYKDAVRGNDGVKHFVHASERYPYTSFGRLNTAPLFCETTLNLINPNGYAAIIVPTGIATDSFNQHFFNHIVKTNSLSSLYDFENRSGLFPDVDSRMKFCLLTLNGSAKYSNTMNFAFFAHDVTDIGNARFELTRNDIVLLNPNTKTTPIFRSRLDAELTKSIYQRVPILIREGEPDINPWGIKFQLMFMMNTDSDKFHTRADLESRGFTLEGNTFVSSSDDSDKSPLSPCGRGVWGEGSSPLPAALRSQDDAPIHPPLGHLHAERQDPRHDA